MNNPKVSIIILNWNGLNDTIECLGSVKKIDYSNYEIIVVDNASSDGSPEKILELFPKATLIKNKENLGYAEGNNVGISYAILNGAEYILLLNNDTVVDPQILSSFIDAADRYPKAGIFGAKIYFYSEPKKILFGGIDFDENRLKFVTRGYGQIDNNNVCNIVEETAFANGCALFFRKEVVKKIGLLEPKFFLEFEETDFCFRAKKIGLSSLFIPNAKVWHKVSVSFGGISSPMLSYFYSRNQLLWAQRHLSISQRRKLYLEIAKDFFSCSFNLKRFPLIKRLYWDIKGIFEDYPIIIAKLIGIKDFTFKHFGNCPICITKLNGKLKKF